ncbi:MAG TPA: hypothetical protein DCY42_05775 [Chloroflexi bacterium]|nr:hypothetical protein [Chloroflexota bacterium]
MRADRLLKMMLLLQTRGKHTAEALAEMLEVSVRTIYRDVNSLSISGIPIYTEKGPGGGIQLIEDYRTSLTGLSEEEVKALFMLNVPGAMTSLGMAEDIQTAMLKLSAALPKSLQHAQAGVRQRIIIDEEWWKAGHDRAPSFLKSLYQAVWQDRCVKVLVEYGFGYRTERILEAYGLVSRGEKWYLVSGVANQMKVFSLQEFVSLDVLEDKFLRKKDFDLAAFWQSWLASRGIEQHGFQCHLLVRTDVFGAFRNLAGVQILSMEKMPDAEQYLVSLWFENFSHARATVLGFGNAVEALEPLALRSSIADYARQTLKLYEE